VSLSHGVEKRFRDLENIPVSLSQLDPGSSQVFSETELYNPLSSVAKYIYTLNIEKKVITL